MENDQNPLQLKILIAFYWPDVFVKIIYFSNSGLAKSEVISYGNCHTLSPF